MATTMKSGSPTSVTTPIWGSGSKVNCLKLLEKILLSSSKRGKSCLLPPKSWIELSVKTPYYLSMGFRTQRSFNSSLMRTKQWLNLYRKWSSNNKLQKNHPKLCKTPSNLSSRAKKHYNRLWFLNSKMYRMPRKPQQSFSLDSCLA